MSGLMAQARNRFSRRTVAAAFAAGCLTLAATGGASFANAEEKRMEQRSVTVSGTGMVLAEPDVARLTAGLMTEGATAKDALAANTTAMRKVIDQVKASGIDGKDIRTTSFHVEPVMTHPKDGAPRISGYRVSNQIGVTVRNLDKVGDVLDKLVTAGANQIHGLSFEVSKAETLKDEARKLAVENAQRRAKLLASASGAEVGRALQIVEEGEGGGGPQPVFRAKAMSAGPVPAERGEQALTATVTVTWELK